jgi:hypothetical protein
MPVAAENVAGVEKFAPAAALQAVDLPASEPAKDGKADSAGTRENKAFAGSGTGSGTGEKLSSGTPAPASSGTLRFSTRGWRTEINTKGNGTTRFWMWRRGRGSNRESRYGGMFRTLSPERMAQYEANRRSYAKRKQKAKRSKAQANHTD